MLYEQIRYTKKKKKLNFINTIYFLYIGKSYIAFKWIGKTLEWTSMVQSFIYLHIILKITFIETFNYSIL